MRTMLLVAAHSLAIIAAAVAFCSVLCDTDTRTRCEEQAVRCDNSVR